MNKKYNWIFYLITPTLLALWLYTGQSGWYNILATYMTIAFVSVAIVGFAVFMCQANDVKFVTKKIQDELAFSNTKTRLSIFLSLTYASILIWHDKFIIGGMVLMMLATGFWINGYVKNLKADELAPEKTDVQNEY